MTLLTVWAEDDPQTTETKTEEFTEIVAALKEIDVRLQRWELAELGGQPSQDEVLAAYRDRIDEIIAREGYSTVDVALLRPSEDESWPATAAAARGKFLREHTHDDDEDRFFVSGSGIFYLHVRARVYAVLCEAGDLLSVPANTTHWFDMGTNPDFVAVRFFHDDDGWIGDFTGSEIAATFPSYDEIVAAR